MNKKSQKELYMLSDELHEQMISIALITTLYPEHKEELHKAYLSLENVTKSIDSLIKPRDTFLLIHEDGSYATVQLPITNPTEFNDTVHRILDTDTYELATINTNYYLIVDEIAKIKSPSRGLNKAATKLFIGNKYDYIAGPAIVGRKAYIDGEPDMVGLDDDELNSFIARITYDPNQIHKRR